jgi:hypothetical protein
MPFEQHHKIKRNNKIKIKPFLKIGEISPKRIKIKISENEMILESFNH